MIGTYCKGVKNGLKKNQATLTNVGVCKRKATKVHFQGNFAFHFMTSLTQEPFWQSRVTTCCLYHNSPFDFIQRIITVGIYTIIIL